MDCPTESELSSFVMGELSAEEIPRVAAHCEECDDCQVALETLAVHSDTVLDSIRRGMPDMPFTTEEPCLSVSKRTLLEAEASGGFGPTILSTDDQLGQYRIIEKLGQGGMGTVYKARHVKLKRTVALKLLSAGRMWEENVSRFEREMASVGQLSHPNIVVAHDAGEAAGHHYLAMELLDGADLSKLLRANGPLTVGCACELIRQAAIGLHHAHENGLVHRDVKPSNLMLTNDGAVKVLDLGLARTQVGVAENDGEELTTTGQIMGTITYMAPEQCGDSASVGAAADIYGLGASLYKLLAGVPPYSGEQLKTPMQQLAALATVDPPSVGTRRADLPKELVDLIDSMTRREPKERPATMTEVAKRLEPFADSKSVATLLSGGSPSRANTVSVPTIAPVTAASDDAVGKSKLWLTLLGSAVIAAALMFGLAQIRISTKSGDIVITIKGGVPITINEDTLEFKDPNDGKTVRVNVDHERKTLTLRKEGFETETREFDLKSEDGRRISVEFEPKVDREPVVKRMPAEPSPPMKTLSPEARAAREEIIDLMEAGDCKAQKIGEAVSLYFERDHSVDVARVAQLGSRAGIGIARLNASSAADLKQFAEYTRGGAEIVEIRLHSDKHGDESLAWIEKIKPSELVLNNTNFKTSDLGRLFWRTQWRKLEFNNQRLSSEAMEPLKQQEELHTLQLTGASGLDDWDMGELNKLPLKTLRLYHTKVSDKSFDSISRISTLTTLVVAGQIRNANEIGPVIRNIGKLKNLNELLFYSRHTKASDIKPLASSLGSLRLLHCWVKPDSFDGFESFTKLRMLSLDFNGLPDGQHPDLQWLPTLKTLKDVRLSHGTATQLSCFKKVFPGCDVVVSQFGQGLYD